MPKVMVEARLEVNSFHLSAAVGVPDLLATSCVSSHIGFASRSFPNLDPSAFVFAYSCTRGHGRQWAGAGFPVREQRKPGMRRERERES